MLDIVYGGKDAELVAMAAQLGYTDIVIIYNSLDALYGAPRVHHEGVRVSYGLLIDTPQKNLVASLAKQCVHENMLPLVIAHSAIFDRFVAEKTVACLVDVEYVHQKDHLHFRRSGLDQVMCAFITKSKAAAVTSFNRLLGIENKFEQGKILGRIIQNGRFCKKYGVPYTLCSFAHDPLEMKSAHDMRALLRLLGVGSVAVKEGKILCDV